MCDLSPRMYDLTSSRTDAPFDGASCSISTPHSNAVVDFDGDCLAGTLAHGPALGYMGTDCV